MSHGTSTEILHNNIAQRIEAVLLLQKTFTAAARTRLKLNFHHKFIFGKSFSYCLLLSSSCLQYFVNKRLYATISFEQRSEKEAL